VCTSFKVVGVFVRFRCALPAFYSPARLIENAVCLWDENQVTFQGSKENE
jgi:hypothetical protein